MRYFECMRCGEGKADLILRVNSVKLQSQSFVYSGKTVQPKVVLKDTNGKKISSQYSHLVYQNNKAVGMASAIITLKGRYTGTVKKTFKILPRGTSLKGRILSDTNKFIVRWKKQTVQVDGYQIQYSENIKFTGAKSRMVNDCKKTKISVKNQKPGKRYYVRVRTYKKVNGKKYFSKWSKIKVEK